MPLDDTASAMLADPFKRNQMVVLSVLLVAIGIGFFLAWDAGDTAYLVRWFWIGIAIAIVYLLYRIASTVETL